ncbi:hypothetical protein D3877_23990 [Azospirillum cavernae]|uniref:Uncharacterized protein n=1 Tax=Azospirillum cavernae TaxID=2320860 RepID=A0A418VPJ9_9PROT|nr:hypothetical protein [Azospirillum cavernae]RJF78181.1 hypothetical protein D3877_23990 [Azospirillum cavernae]
MTTDPPRPYIRSLPPFFEQADAAGQRVLDRYLWIFQNLLGPAPDPSKPPPPITVQRRAMATVIDALPDLFYPRLSFLFPESDASLPPLTDPRDADSLQWSKVNALNDYFGIVLPQAGEDDEDAWKLAVTAAVNDWLTAQFAWQGAWFGYQGGVPRSVDDQRRNLASILPVFRERGTAAGLQKLLTILAVGSGPISSDATITVTDLTDGMPMTVGRTTKLRPAYPTRSEGPVLGGVRPYSFLITVEGVKSKSRPAAKTFLSRIVDQEKPAHTTYTIKMTS